MMWSYESTDVSMLIVLYNVFYSGHWNMELQKKMTGLRDGRCCNVMVSWYVVTKHRECVVFSKRKQERHAEWDVNNTNETRPTCHESLFAMREIRVVVSRTIFMGLSSPDESFNSTMIDPWEFWTSIYQLGYHIARDLSRIPWSWRWKSCLSTTSTCFCLFNFWFLTLFFWHHHL